ncbi:hypothetical protein [Brevundimonas sp. SORGH_AS_0993]|uniref:hypothetical protein n=1 Tax=Brevundimonas sp. SORGH_AS_0993 TaxID=3041794 RepID=UPI0027873F12|nr:hypothetical protein [Brevundimonas sp. SORGH_AS_0993]MDQ1154712.1 hypothetical protein [Brevundimonas sp. SORGH_AS_0993]
MIRRLAVSAAAVSLCLVSAALSGCDGSKTPKTPEAASGSAPQTVQVPPAAAKPTAPVETPTSDASPIVAGAPAFAVLYPGAELEGAPTLAGGHADGGIVTFRTSASPDAVVEFYRARAESAGLRSVTGMNQGDARAYGAAGGAANDVRLQVVAAPGEGDQTSVQLTWSGAQ